MGGRVKGAWGSALSLAFCPSLMRCDVLRVALLCAPLQRDCSSPFHITPYQGKYPQVPTTPDALHMQRVLAGCADRGATTTVIECKPSSLGDGR